MAAFLHLTNISEVGADDEFLFLAENRESKTQARPERGRRTHAHIAFVKEQK